MTERIRPSAEWYRSKIMAMADDADSLAGPSIFSPSHDEISNEASSTAETTVAAFSALVRLQRRDRKLSVAELASKLKVDETELRNIEGDPHYRARPRTILHIAQLFDLPPKEVMKLAGAAASNDTAFVREAARFAAHSEEMSSLSQEEKRILQEYVEFLRDKT